MLERFILDILWDIVVEKFEVLNLESDRKKKLELGIDLATKLDYLKVEVK